MATLPLTRSKHLLPFASWMNRHGEPVERLLRLAGLPVECLHDPEMLVPISAVSSFRELSARRTGLPNIALAATEHLGIPDLGDLGQIFLTARTLRRSLSLFRENVGTQSSNLDIQLRRQPGGDLFFSHRALSEIGSGEWHRALYTLSWMLKTVRLVDPSWSPSEIWVDAKATPERFEAIESLGSVARFGHQYTGFVIPASMLALPPRNSNSAENGHDVEDDRLWSTAPATTYAEALQQLIRSYASDGWLTIERASEVAYTSVRTMQRRLSAEQTTYFRVVEETRSTMAGELLEGTDATMAEIARQLGYKNQGDFTRAFRRWAGVSPTAFRRDRRLS